jgi:hypothetical protein
MAERLSRKELYDLVWSEPLKTLCSRFGSSDVALKKTCARSKIPTPERGYWAKKDAGKPTLQVALPIRPPGMDDQVLIAAGQSYWYQNWKKEELLCPLPPCPSLRETCLLEHMFQALAPRFADHSKLGARPRLHCSVNQLQGFILLRNPMQRIEGDDHVELFAVPQAGRCAR